MPVLQLKVPELEKLLATDTELLAGSKIVLAPMVRLPAMVRGLVADLVVGPLPMPLDKVKLP